MSLSGPLHAPAELSVRAASQSQGQRQIKRLLQPVLDFLILPSGLHKQHRTVGPYIAGPYSAWHLGTIKQAKQIEEADR